MYLDANEQRVEKQLSENRYVGIGIKLSMDGEKYVIQEPFAGGPAEKIGCRDGDAILTIDGNRTKGKTLAQIVNELRGAEGTNVSIEVQNRDESTPRAYDIIRGVVPMTTVEQSIDEGIAVLRFNSIVGSTAAEFEKIALELRKRDLEGLVLDFRGVAPSELHHVELLADMMFEEHELAVVHTVKGERTVRTRRDSLLPHVPVAALADPIVPGSLFFVLPSLKSHRGAIFVGRSNIASDMICRCAVEFPGESGAISGLPNAVCRPVGMRMRHDDAGEGLHFGSMDAGRLSPSFLGVMPIDITATEGEVYKSAVATLRNQAARN
jgi:carboxyl-terminal processing protease